MAVTEHLDRFQQKHSVGRVPGRALACMFFDDFGTYLAALLTSSGFVSLFPLLLLASTGLGFVLSGDQRLQHEVLTSALDQFPVIGGDLAQPKHLGGGPVGLVVGIAGSLYGGLGVAQVFQYAANTVLAVPRNNGPNPFKVRGRSVLLLVTAGLAVLGHDRLVNRGRRRGRGARDSTKVPDAGGVRRDQHRGDHLCVPLCAGPAAIRARRRAWRDSLGGDLAAAAILRGDLRIQHMVKHASATNAVFALVLGLLAFLYITAAAILLSMEINVVRVNRLRPQLMLTPFTDNVALTARRPARVLPPG